MTWLDTPAAQWAETAAASAARSGRFGGRHEVLECAVDPARACVER